MPDLRATMSCVGGVARCQSCEYQIWYFVVLRQVSCDGFSFVSSPLSLLLRRSSPSFVVSFVRRLLRSSLPPHPSPSFSISLRLLMLTSRPCPLPYHPCAAESVARCISVAPRRYRPVSLLLSLSRATKPPTSTSLSLMRRGERRALYFHSKSSLSPCLTAALALQVLTPQSPTSTLLRPTAIESISRCHLAATSSRCQYKANAPALPCCSGALAHASRRIRH